MLRFGLIQRLAALTACTILVLFMLFLHTLEPTSMNRTTKSIWDGTELFQRSLHASQHPKSCDDAKFLILKYQHPWGMGSFLHIRSLQLLLALDVGRVAVDDPNVDWKWASLGKEWCNSTGPDCYWLPLSKCSVPLDYRSLQDAQPWGRHNPDTKFVYQDENDDSYRVHESGNYTLSFHSQNTATIARRPGSFEYKRFGHITSLHFWMAQMIHYVTRPNALTSDVITATIRKTFPNRTVPPNMATVFIRRGDKAGEMPLVSVQNHLELIPAGVTDVFLGSDSEAAIQEVIQAAGDRYTFHVAEGRRNANGSIFVEENAQRWFKPEIVEHTKVLLANLYISAMGSVMIGQLGSNWARVMHELHDTSGAAHFPFLSPGACDNDKRLLVVGTMTMYNKLARKLARMIWIWWTWQSAKEVNDSLGPVWEDWCEGT